MMRRLPLVFLSAACLVFVACGDDETPAPNPGAACADNSECGRGLVCEAGFCVSADAPGTDTGTGTGTDAGTDTPVLDVGVNDTEPLECESGVECVRASDCAVIDNAQCIEGCCVAGTPPVGACTGHLDDCSSDTQTTDEFFCDTEAGQCLQRCDFDRADETQSADCPLNSYCLAELTVDDPLALNGVCLPGDCESNIFDPDACDGTGTCLPVGNGASYCIPGGTGAEGDDCNTIADSQPASDICSPGLMCFQGTCTPPCDLDEDECGDLECVRAFDVTPRNRPGVCGTECPEFSGDSCNEGEVCSIIPGRFGINTWMCIEVDGDAVEIDEGEDCSGDDTVCTAGTICVSVDDAGGAECLPICDPLGGAEGEFAGCANEGNVCSPSALDGLGFCQEGCEPYPRRPGDYGCEDGTNTCLPFVHRDDRPVEPEGFCAEDEGFAGAYESCSNPGFLGGDCLDFAVCLELEEGGPSECLPLCEPFGAGVCPGEASCSGIPPLLGQLNFSFCFPGAQPGNIGDRCTEEGLACAADDSICLDTGAGPVCLAICREGFDDCSEVGGACSTGLLNPDVVPAYMGLCT